MSPAEACWLWPDTLFWSNINIRCYHLLSDELRALVIERFAQGAPDGAQFALEVSEHLPTNWCDSMRAVLEMLREIA